MVLGGALGDDIIPPRGILRKSRWTLTIKTASRWAERCISRQRSIIHTRTIVRIVRIPIILVLGHHNLRRTGSRTLAEKISWSTGSWLVRLESVRALGPTLEWWQCWHPGRGK